MEKEKIVIVENGLNEDFYSFLVEQAEAEADMFSSIADMYADQDEAEADMYGGMAEMYSDQAEADADMYEMYFDQAEDEAKMYSGMAEMYAEQAEIEAAMYSSMFYGGSAPEKQVDKWIAIYNDYSTKSSENRKDLPLENLLCFLYKKFRRPSNTGKTAYFSYHFKSHNLEDCYLQIGNYKCKEAEEEHWVAWEYENGTIIEKHYLTRELELNKQFKSQRMIYFPLDYHFASLIPLDKFNPYNFSFQRLNFMAKGSKSHCGDKFSRLKVYDLKGGFLEFTIFDFENNIIKLLKSLNTSKSFLSFIFEEQLKYSSGILDRTKLNFYTTKNPYEEISYKNIKANIERLIDRSYKFLPSSTKQDPVGEINTLINKVSEFKN